MRRLNFSFPQRMCGLRNPVSKSRRRSPHTFVAFRGVMSFVFVTVESRNPRQKDARFFYLLKNSDTLNPGEKDDAELMKRLRTDVNHVFQNTSTRGTGSTGSATNALANAYIRVVELMAQLIRMIYDGYRDLMDNKSDPRVNDWAMMSGPFPTLAICLFYAYFVKVLGPKLMENRKPFDLRRVMIWYNLFQVIFSSWLFNESMVSGWGGHYSFRCQPVDYSNNPIAMRMARGCWWYYISKFVEFTDTIFFVLRKKNDHISTLHVIHHGIMPMSVWFGVKFTPGGHSTFFGCLNTFVHIVMYSYYLLAALGPQIQPYLWWKKYLTTLQMIQFILVMIHAFQLLFIDCNYPKAFVWLIGMHAVMFYFLFRGFYKEAYKKKDPKNASGKQKVLKYDKEQNTQSLQDDNKENENGVIYANQYKMATGYISDSGLRNRVFIDNRGFDE